jgi:hypothetical protein
MRASEARAVEDLIEFGAQVKLLRRPMHANPREGLALSIATPGSRPRSCSSNLSHAAMLDGCEWNVRLSAVDNKTVLDKFIATFRYTPHPPPKPLAVNDTRTRHES